MVFVCDHGGAHTDPAAQLPFPLPTRRPGVPNTQFDRMFALTAFHPLPPASAQAKATLTALGRRLRPGGRLYVAGELPLPARGRPVTPDTWV